jgi:hypothetical protein
MPIDHRVVMQPLYDVSFGLLALSGTSIGVLMTPARNGQ